MAYNKKKIYEQALADAEKYHFFFIDDLVAWLGISRTTFYSFFPAESDKLNKIKEQLEKNKLTTKHEIRNRWSKSDNPSEQIALYKLIATPEERKKLSSNYIELTGENGKPINLQQERDLTTAEAADFIAEVNKRI